MRKVFFALVLTCAATASAQSNGTMSLNATVSKTAALRYDSHSVNGLGVTGSNSGGSGLNFSLNFGDLAVVFGSNEMYHGGTVTLALRSNAGYQVTAIVSGSTFGTATGDLRLADIGYGVPNTASTIRPSGVLGSNTGTAVPTIFNYDPLTATVTDGLPVFTGTVNNLTASTVVLSGGRISSGGSLATTTNALLVDTKFAIYPQFFTPTTAPLSATVTYTISTP